MTLTLARKDYEPELRQSRHHHEEWTVSVVVRGTVRETTAFGELDLEAGSVVVKPPGVAHANAFGPAGARLLTVGGFDAPPGGRYRVARCGAIAAAALRIHLRADMSEELWDVIACVDERPTSSTLVTAAERILREEPLTVAVLAERLDVHPVSLARAFRKHRGYAVGEAIRRRRVEIALRLIGDSARPLADVALDSGFCDQSHMNRALKVMVGITPRQYRRLAAEV